MKKKIKIIFYLLVIVFLICSWCSVSKPSKSTVPNTDTSTTFSSSIVTTTTSL